MSQSTRFFTPIGIIVAILGVLVAVGLGNDLITWIGSGEWSPLTLGAFWASIDIASLNLVQAAVQRYLHPDLWWHVLEPMLHWPVWVPPLVIAALFYVLKRKPWHSST